MIIYPRARFFHKVGAAAIFGLFMIAGAPAARADSIYSNWDTATDTTFASGYYPSIQTATVTAGTPPSGLTIYSLTLHFDKADGGTSYTKIQYITATTTYQGACETVPMPTGAGIHTLFLPTPEKVPYGTISVNWSSAFAAGCGATDWNTNTHWSLYQNADSTRYSIFNFGNITDTNTRIDVVSPYNGQTVASTSPVTLEASGYVNSSVSDLTNVDNTDGLQVKWNVYSAEQKNNCIDVICILGGGGGIAGVDYYSGTGYSVFSSQFFNVSTTTSGNLAGGYYTLTTSVIMPKKIWGISSLFGFGFGQTTIVSTTTSFIVGTPTAAQTYLHDIYTATQQGENNLTATSSAVSLSSCNPFSLDLGLCLAVLFFPDQNNLQNLVQFSKDNFLSRAPWGYATRLVTILSDNATTTATSTLPTFTVAFASSSPLYGNTISFDMEDMLQGGAAITNSLVDPISGKSMRDITEPFIQLFIAISALIIIFHDLMSMGEDSKSRGRGEGGSSNANPEKYREWLYNNRK